MSKALDSSVTFRLTAGEKAALEVLAQRRAAEMAERGDVPDDTVNGYLRSLVRREAKAADIAVDDGVRRGVARGNAAGGPARTSPRRGITRGQ